MQLIDAVLKGVIQGLTEFLPVSSTAHLILYDAIGRLFHLQPEPLSPYVEEFFAIMLHLGTLVSVLVYFRRDLWALWQSIVKRGVVDEPSSDSATWDYPSLLKALPVSFLVTAVLALGVVKGSSYVFDALGWATQDVRDISEFYLRNPNFVILHLVVTGLLLWVSETVLAKKGTVDTPPTQVTQRQAFAVGLFQAGAAIFHGISRSGSTIAAGVLTGLTRQAAARYSFLLSLPVFTAATLYELLKLNGQGSLMALPWTPMLIGMGVSALVGYACIATFIPFVARRSLKGFAIYCWVVSITLFFLFNGL